MVPVRDNFPNEHEVLKVSVWCGFNFMAVVIFMASARLGGEKLNAAIATAVEIVRSIEHVQIPDGWHHDEEDLFEILTFFADEMSWH